MSARKTSSGASESWYNPGYTWKSPDRIDSIEFPILTQWGERMDFIIPFIEKTDEASIREYTKQRRVLAKRLGTFTSDTLWLKKYLLYARFLKPKLPDNVRTILEDFLVEMAKQGVRGLPRRLEALERTAVGFVKLKLKDAVDEDDAYDTISLFNQILKFYKQEVTTVRNARDLTFLECLNALEKSKPQKWALDNLIQKVCLENSSIDLYIGEVKKSQYNYKIKVLKSLFKQHPNIQICGENPTVYAWIDTTTADKRSKDNSTRLDSKTIEQSSDATDAMDDVLQEVGKVENREKYYNNNNNPTNNNNQATDNDSLTSQKSIDKAKEMASDTSVSSYDNSISITSNKKFERKLQLQHMPSALILSNEDLGEDDDGIGEF